MRAILGIPSLLSKSSLNSTVQPNNFMEKFKMAFRNAKNKRNNEIIIHNTKPLRNV